MEDRVLLPENLCFVNSRVFLAPYICLTSIVLADLLGLDRLTNAFVVLVISRSIACFVGTPLAGWIFVVI